jgi:hypothetical protein
VTELVGSDIPSVDAPGWKGPIGGFFLCGKFVIGRSWADIKSSRLPSSSDDPLSSSEEDEEDEEDEV